MKESIAVVLLSLSFSAHAVLDDGIDYKNIESWGAHTSESTISNLNKGARYFEQTRVLAPDAFDGSYMRIRKYPNGVLAVFNRDAELPYAFCKVPVKGTITCHAAEWTESFTVGEGDIRTGAKVTVHRMYGAEARRSLRGYGVYEGTFVLPKM